MSAYKCMKKASIRCRWISFWIYLKIERLLAKEPLLLSVLPFWPYCGTWLTATSTVTSQSCWRIGGTTARNTSVSSPGSRVLRANCSTWLGALPSFTVCRSISTGPDPEESVCYSCAFILTPLSAAGREMDLHRMLNSQLSSAKMCSILRFLFDGIMLIENTFLS